MDDRAAKLALARKKLRDHQEKKLCNIPKDNIECKLISNDIENTLNDTSNQQHLKNSQDVNIQHDNLMIACEVPIDIEGNNDSDAMKKIEENKSLTPEVNIAEILISNKRKLELQIDNLQNKIYQLETSHADITNNYKVCNQKVVNLENELQSIYNKYETVTKDVLLKESEIEDVKSAKLLLLEEKSNLLEQLEFTKAVLSAKEAENDSLHCQLYNLQSQYDVLQLKLQQLTNGPSEQTENNIDLEKNGTLLLKVSGLEQQLNLLQKERDQINVHYQHYVAELNEQLKTLVKRNEELTIEVQCLSNRENSLIEQISEMEIRIQNYNMVKKQAEIPQNTILNDSELQHDFRKVQAELNQLRTKHEELEKMYADSNVKIMQLSELKESECKHDNISLSKLNADITSDKVAAQRATVQNKKLKQDLQTLEDDFVKMSKDKLELTEKLTAEKYLSRELTFKLAEIDEKAKDMQSKLKAKDDEMIRLLTNYRSLENHCEELKHLEKNVNNDHEDIDCEEKNVVSGNENIICEPSENSEETRLPKDDAMLKLQERFLKIMGEVADLSDEKHRLEHIILQLQNETDTICEYVALYQQQRSLLKRRDEERSAQLKIFQQECGKLKSQLEELTTILKRFAEDTQLSIYFQNETKLKDINQVMDLLSELKKNSLIDPKKKSIEFKNFYPCNCCSGKLLDV